MEHWHTPHVVADLPPAQRVLVLAPHPDDEIFGCGGVLALYRRQGAHVQVHVLTDGAGYAPDRERAEIARIRMAETDAALSRLDIGPASTSGLRDRTLAGLARLPLHVAEVIARHRPEVVLFPADGEIHPDHRALARAVRGALAVEPAIGGPSRPVLLNLGQGVAASHRLNHPQPTKQRHWGILVNVHLGPPVLKSDDLAVISFSQLDRGDNVLRHHT